MVYFAGTVRRSKMVNPYHTEWIQLFLKDTLDSSKYMESYEKVLIAWIAIKDTLMYEHSSAQFNAQPTLFIFQKYAQTLFDGFLQSRLSGYSPDQDGETIQLADDGVDCESIDDEGATDSDDLHRYKEILYSVKIKNGKEKILIKFY